MTSTLGALLDGAVDRFGDRPLLLAGQETRTYGEFGRRVNGLAHGFRSIGIRRGDPVAVVLPSSVELLMVWLATAHIGAVAVPLNPALSDPELEPLLRHAQASVVVTDRPGAPWARCRRTVRVGHADAGPSLADLADLAGPVPHAPDCRVVAEDAAAILYTSGSTGSPKGCVLTHDSYTLPAPAFVARVGIRADDRLLVCLPLFHLAGQAFTVSALQSGAGIGLREKFSARRFWRDVDDIDATVFRHLGEMLTLIMRTGQPPRSRHSLRLVYGAGARLEVASEFAERFGVTVVEGYGLSETNTVLCGYPDQARAGSIGRPLPHVEVRIADQAGIPVPPGVDGEIQVRRNPALMTGYHRNGERTAAAMAGEWFRTGDVGRVDTDGWFYFSARRNDIIRRRGENVDPAEVEEVLARHPNINFGAVVGMPTGTSDEDIAAFVVPRAGAALEVAELTDWCRTRLAAFKVPNSFALVRRLPMTATSKINRSLLRTAQWKEPGMVRNDWLAEVARRLRRHIVHMAADSPGAHVGGSMSAVEILTTLYFDGVLRIDPREPGAPDRDRLIYSKGHASAAYYAALAEAGFFPVDELATYKHSGSRLAGHPHTGVPGVELATGSLGHGLPVGVGLAIGARYERSAGRVFVVLGDGECQEGSVWEAAMAAAHYRLDNLVAIVDRNGIQEDGPTEEIMALEPFADKWRGFGWNVVEVDGHDLDALSAALHAVPAREGRPTVLIANTVKGRGVSFAENTNAWHYGKLTEEQKRQALGELAATGGPR